ncbi:MAG: hypothetical protein DBY45_02575 [Clostridiales bacterium]|nr:MAG: hypothetical protein DBY45_02575 [Clostridiales bacterium]
MINRKMKILSVATAMTILFAASSSALPVSAFENGQSAGIGTVTSSQNEAIDGEGSGLEYSTSVITGTDGNNHGVKTITFNPTTSDYMPMVYSQYSGYGSRTIRAAENAESKHGYDVKAGVNASFFVLSGGDISGSTYGGVNISDGKVFQGCNNYGPTWMLTFDSDGKSDLVYSRVAYELKLNGEVKRGALENININPVSGKTTTGIYYWDTSCGTATDTKDPGVEIVFNKVDDTELVVGGTLVGEVCEIRANVSSGNDVGYDQFVLYASDKSQWASELRGLKIGDKAHITCTETIAAAKEAMENCNGALVTYGYHLVEDGRNVTSSFPLGDSFSKARAQRTVIGVKEDGTLLILVSDGRTSTYPGMTLYELADLLISQGCVTGINLDGGGSTQMTIENTSGKLEEVLSSARSVANSLLVVKRPETSHNLVAQKREKLQSLISMAESSGLSSLAAYGESIYNSATSMPGDYTKAIMALQEEIGRIIITDLPSTAIGLIGASLTLSIEAEPIGGGTLSYQWYKDNVAIEGATGSSYTVDSVTESDAGNYKVVVTNTIGETSTTAFSTVCTVEVSDGNNIVKGLKYTTSLKDGGANAGLGDFHDDHPDVERVKLTDGYYAASWSDSNSVGYHKRTGLPVDLTFHLGDKPQTFQQINIGAFSPNANGITIQSNTKIEIKNGAGDEWHVICDAPTAGSLGKDKRFIFATEDGKNISATDIRFTLALGSSWLFLDEIEVLRDGDGSTPDSTLTVPISTIQTPAFTTNLETAQSVKDGESLSLSVTATVTDGGTLTYQWYKDNQAISGATKASYTIDSAKKSDEGSYKVVVTNTKNDVTATATSNVCAVTVESIVVTPPATPVFTTNLGTAQTVKDGGTLSLSVAATVTDGGTLTYQWYKDNQAISGATKASYTIDSAKKSDEGSYKVVVTNTKNGATATATSNACAVTVESIVVTPPATPVFTTNLGTAQTVKDGGTLSLSVAATVTDGGTLTYQWYKDNQAISGATQASYTIASAKKSDEGSYKVVVTNTKNDATATATSNVCAVTLQVPDEPKAPTITTNLSSVKTAQTGDSVNLTVKAVSNNSGTLSYQWYKNGNMIAGATSDSYTIASASVSDGGIYYVEVTDKSNNTHTLSNSCTLTVAEKDVPSGGGSSGGWIGGGSSRPSKPSTPEEPKPTSPTWEEIDGVWKLKGIDGDYLTGWQKVDGAWYYLGANGAMRTGWFQDGNKWYYLKSSGAMVTGWLKLQNTWYYLGANGVMRTGWLFDNGVWYYLYDWGGMANTSWVNVNTNENGVYISRWYYFRGNGAMLTGWLQQGANWYYLNADGAMAHDRWLLIDGKYYYFYSSGSMATDTTVGGYKVDVSGQWIQ